MKAEFTGADGPIEVGKLSSNVNDGLEVKPPVPGDASVHAMTAVIAFALQKPLGVTI